MVSPFTLARPSAWPTPAAARCAAAIGLAAITTGILIATTVLFFLDTTHLDTATITRAASIGAGAGLLVVPLFGRAAARVSATRVYTALLIIELVTLIAWQISGPTAWHMGCIIAAEVCRAGFSATLGSMLTELGIPTAAITSTRAALRTVSNMGIGLGGLIAAALITHSARTALVAAILSIAAAGWVLLSLTPQFTVAPERARPYADGRYLGLAVTNGLLSTHTQVLTFGIPATVAATGVLPPRLVGVCTAINALGIIFFQVPTARRSITLPRGLCIAISTIATTSMGLALAFGAHHPTVWIVLTAAVALTVGELWQTAVEYDVSYAAAPDNQHQQYQAAYSLGHGVMRAATPVALGAAVAAGAAGWLIVAAVSATAGLSHWVLARTVPSPAQ